MVVYKLNMDLTDTTKYYWIKPTDGSDEEKESKLQYYLTENRIVYPVDSEIYQQLNWPALKRNDKRRVNQLTAVAIDPPGDQCPERTAWIPTISIDIVQI